MQPVPCVALLNCSVSCIPLVRWPCVSTRTVALVSSCGVSAGTDHLRTHLRCTHRCKTHMLSTCLFMCACSVYAGQQSVLISPMDLEVNPSLWLQSVSQFKVRDTFCSYSVMELCTRSLSSLTDSLKVRTHTHTEF